MEKPSESILPRLQDGGYPVVQVANVSRTEAGKLSPLMDDVRENYLLASEPNGSDVRVYLKTVARPYTGEHGIHLLTIPDRADHQNIPGIKDLSPHDLSRVLVLTESVSRHALELPGISEVDFGLHHSRAELINIPKQRIASFPQNLHVHTAAFSEEDMHPVTTQDIIASPELRGKTGEVLHLLGEELLFGEIVPELAREYANFTELFQEVRDSRGRRRFSLLLGKETFTREGFAEILQAIDAKGERVYDEIAKCFFKYDEESNQFVARNDAHARLALLPKQERNKNIRDYIEQKPWLSGGVKMGLAWLAFNAKDENEIVKRVYEETKQKSIAEQEKALKIAADRFWAYKDFAYVMSFSAKKAKDGSISDWIFAFDPKIFNVEGIVQSSAFTDKLIVRNQSEVMNQRVLGDLQEREKAVVDAVLEENQGYTPGPLIHTTNK